MGGYYARLLSGRRLRQCYEIAAPRVKQYLEAEMGFVLGRLEPGDDVLELGCGYGRVGFRLAEVARRVVGVDTSPESIALAREAAGPGSRCEFLLMDAVALAFAESTFDKVVCIQNGICAFGVEKDSLLREALRVTRPGGRILFSTYSPLFWDHRLEWFEAQAAVGLVGAIDHERTGSGTIVCRDGFRVGTMSPEAFRSLTRRLGLEAEISEVDESSIFCNILVPGSV